MKSFAKNNGKIDWAEDMRAGKIFHSAITKYFRELLRIRLGCIRFEISKQAYVRTGKGKALDNEPVAEILEEILRWARGFSSFVFATNATA